MPTDAELEELFVWGDRVARAAGLTEEKLRDILREVRSRREDGPTIAALKAHICDAFALLRDGARGNAEAEAKITGWQEWFESDGCAMLDGINPQRPGLATQVEATHELLSIAEDEVHRQYERAWPTLLDCIVNVVPVLCREPKM